MAARDQTAKFHQFRASRRAFAQLEQWTETNVVDGLLAPSYEDRDIELGSDSISPEHVAFPLWVKCVNAMNVHCDAVECELRRIAALQRQQLLVTFNVSQVEKVEQALKDATAIVHKRLRAAERNCLLHIVAAISGSITVRIKCCTVVAAERKSVPC